MGNHSLRDDKECQNCGHTVEEKFCPNCGQKNTETRQSFGHLFTHFFEDLTHYDTAFWQTIKYLLFRPALLTKEYLMGKRQSYVPPVKLYIFISFVTFFLPAILPDSGKEVDAKPTPGSVQYDNKQAWPLDKKMANKETVWLDNYAVGEGIYNPMMYKSVEEMDSIEKLKPESLRLSSLEYKLGQRLLALYDHSTPKEVLQKFNESFLHNLSKALFVYMPIFAFFLWLFHSKKRWYFFDHGIFTLHYFSFLLLTISIFIVFYTISNWINNTLIDDILFGYLLPLTLLWHIYYFYRAHRKMYHESWVLNFLKSTMMFIINMVSILFIVAFFALLTIYNLH
jgi:hypothetical protein